MLYLGLLKRIIPFVLTFAAGLFIASFFVSIALPSVGSRNRRSHCREHKMLREELRNSEDEVRRLREQLAAAETRSDWYRDSLDTTLAPAIEEMPPPPPAPVVKKHKNERVIVLR